jgi:hypothetical protein
LNGFDGPHEAGRFQCGSERGKILSADEQVDVARIAYCSLIDFGHPRGDGMAAHDGVWNAGTVEHLGCPQ